MPIYRIAYSKDAAKVLNGLPRNVAVRIVTKLDQLAADPAGLANNIQAVVGEPGLLRLRIGAWRAVFRFTDDTIMVRTIASRSRAYRVKR